MSGRTSTRPGLLRRVRSWVDGTLWALPTAGVLVAVALGALLPRVELGWQESQAGPLLFGGGAAAARDSLAAIAGSLISVTGLVFSLTMVALQLGSSQYSPRVLRTFAADPYVRWTLTVLVLTFTFALVVLRTVRSETARTTAQGVDAFVPRFSVSLAYLLALVSVLAVVLFLGHLARSLRVETMLSELHRDALGTIEQHLGEQPPPQDDDPLPAVLAAVTGPAHVLAARDTGFLVDVDEESLVRAAAGCGALVLLVPRLGDGLVAGAPMAHAWATGPTGVDAGVLSDAVAAALRVDVERRGDRDVAYALRTMVDVAVRALSPGVNDPTTAVHALVRISSVLGALLERCPRSRLLRDDDGRPRVVVREWDAAALLQVAVEEPLRFAEGQPAVLRRLAAMLREVAWRTPHGCVDDELREAARAVAACAAASTSVGAAERELWLRDVEDALGRRWRVDWPLLEEPGIRR